MVNTSMEFKHPRYYAALRAQLRKYQAAEDIRAASDKQQATEIQASSDKHQAPSCKPQASSREQQAAQSRYPHKVSSN